MMARALQIRVESSSVSFGTLPTSLESQRHVQQGASQSLEVTISKIFASRGHSHSLYSFRSRTFQTDHTADPHSHWTQRARFAGSPVSRGFVLLPSPVSPFLQSNQSLARGARRRGQSLRPKAGASDAMDGQESLLPDAVLANLRHKGMTIWEFYYDTSAETYGEGDFGEEVRALQGYLLTTGLFESEHGATGFFGPATQAALIEWQREHGVEPALGVWGPFSRDKYRQLVAEDAARQGLLYQGAEKPSVRAADRPGPSRLKAEASPPASSASISVPVKAPAASHAGGGLTLAHSLVAAFVVLGGVIVAGVFLRRKKVPSRVSLDPQELDRAKNMLELDRTGGPQPRTEQTGRQNGDLKKR